jgi:gliding motility-associated lipoprotein GldH
MKRSKSIMLILLFGVLGTSCSLLYAFREIQEIPGWKWASSDVRSFTFENPETQILDGTFLFRHVHGFGYASINIRAEIISDSERIDTTFTIPIRDENGDYLGEGAGDLWDVEHTFLHGYEFKPGTYTLTFEQKNADPLPLVMEVGVELAETR